MKLQSRLWRPVLISMLATVVVCTNAFALCESLFEYGIYDIDGKTDDADRTASFREWICQRQFPGKADAAKFVAATGIPSEFLPGKFGPNDSETDFKDSYAAFCADKDMNSPLNRDLTRNLKKINEKMLGSFNACIARDGLHAWIRQTKEPGRFYLNFLHRKSDSRSKPASIITITRFNVACDSLFLPFELAGTEKRFFCTRIDPTSLSTLWVLSSEPVLEGSSYWVGKYTYTPTADLPASP